MVAYLLEDNDDVAFAGNGKLFLNVGRDVRVFVYDHVGGRA